MINADYKGELIFNLEADRRVDAGKGGYMIHVSNNTKLDCYATCRREECKASKANSSTKVNLTMKSTVFIMSVMFLLKMGFVVNTDNNP